NSGGTLLRLYHMPTRLGFTPSRAANASRSLNMASADSRDGRELGFLRITACDCAEHAPRLSSTHCATHNPCLQNENDRLGARLRQRREALGLTQQEVADRCGWKGQNRVSNYENGKRPIRP